MPRKDPKEWYAANRAQITAGRRLKYAEDKERISMERRAAYKPGPTSRKIKNYKKNHYQKNKAYYRERSLNRTFGITTADYDKLLTVQGGVCAGCQSPSTNEKRTKNFCVDHDHKTGKIRGLLCGPCNRGLGYLHDSPELLERLAAYVRAIP
jgi:hypothetical protein